MPVTNVLERLNGEIKRCANVHGLSRRTYRRGHTGTFSTPADETADNCIDHP